jgi:hypothetical protein
VIRPALLATCLLVAACGVVAPSSAQVGPDCVTQPESLLSASDLPNGLSQSSEGRRPMLGLLGNGDSDYPNFRGRAQRNFLWVGLSNGAPRTLVNKAWSDLHYSGEAPSGFIPNDGPLFTDYPQQVFRISEASLDFGTVSEAQKWMDAQRVMNAPNSDPSTRNGIEGDLTTTPIGDESLAYQISHGSSGDLVTGIQARFGSIVYGVSFDSGPKFAADGIAVSLIKKLEAHVHGLCASG